jgi:hypothetical protein
MSKSWLLIVKINKQINKNYRTFKKNLPNKFFCCVTIELKIFGWNSRSFVTFVTVALDSEIIIIQSRD